VCSWWDRHPCLSCANDPGPREQASLSASLEFACFDTEWGWVAVMGSPGGLCRTILPAPDEGSAIDAITRGVTAIRQEAAFTEVKRALINYFKGEQVEFLFPIDPDLEGCTCFQRDVWEATLKIPYGQLRSYGWIAAEIGRGRAARAVGQALGANRLPIIVPCHRVIRSDGSMGGFSGGLHWKKELIKLEKAIFVP
jgi:methylated-DNA-[protein]-cysteine S-methyltransferase